VVAIIVSGGVRSFRTLFQIVTRGPILDKKNVPNNQNNERITVDFK